MKPCNNLPVTLIKFWISSALSPFLSSFVPLTRVAQTTLWLPEDAVSYLINFNNCFVSVPLSGANLCSHVARFWRSLQNKVHTLGRQYSPCKSERQKLLTWKVNNYCLLTLQSSYVSARFQLIDKSIINTLCIEGSLVDFLLSVLKWSILTTLGDFLSGDSEIPNDDIKAKNVLLQCFGGQPIYFLISTWLYITVYDSLSFTSLYNIMEHKITLLKLRLATATHNFDNLVFI